MTKAMAPITGGRICPLVEATASTAAANLGVYPARFISGIVRMPVDAAFADGEHDTDPKSALAPTAAFAGPPPLCPVRVIATSRNHHPAPAAVVSAPKLIKSMNSQPVTHLVRPNMHLQTTQVVNNRAQAHSP